MINSKCTRTLPRDPQIPWVGAYLFAKRDLCAKYEAYKPLFICFIDTVYLFNFFITISAYRHLIKFGHSTLP